LLASTYRGIEKLTDWTGRCAAWLALAMTLLTCLVVLLRYGFHFGSIAAQEAISYLHATLFMLGAAYTLQRGGHVRVDIFYSRFTVIQQAWVNAAGSIVLLLPFCAFIAAISWEFVQNSWAIKEISPEPGGIPAVFILKSLIPVMAVSLLLQGLAEVIKSLLILMGANSNKPRASNLDANSPDASRLEGI